MRPGTVINVYSPQEIAKAAGVPEGLAIAAIGSADALVAHAEAVRLGRALRRGTTVPPRALFSVFRSTLPAHHGGVTLALSGTVHAAIIATVILVTTFSLTPAATTLSQDSRPVESMRLDFPGQTGARRRGRWRRIAPEAATAEGSSRREAANQQPAPHPAAPAASRTCRRGARADSSSAPGESAAGNRRTSREAPADTRDRTGILEETRADQDSNGAGRGAGVGSGAGTGLGEGTGSGIGPGSGGGTGGGPFRPGAGIEPPRLITEVKPSYPDDARQRGLEGEVDMEIVVRRDGSVGNVRILKGLSGAMNERAAEAVRQWRFSPARRQGIQSM